MKDLSKKQIESQIGIEVKLSLPLSWKGIKNKLYVFKKRAVNIFKKHR